MMNSKIKKVVEGEWGTTTLYDADSVDENLKEIAEPQIAMTAALIDKSVALEETETLLSVKEDAEDDVYTLNPSEHPYMLPQLQLYLQATILEESITELRILTSCNTEMRITKTMSDMPLLLALKYGVEQPKVKDELDSIDQSKLNCMEYKLNKLDADRNFFGDVLTLLYKCLCLDKNFQTLVDFVNCIVGRDNYYKSLQEDEAKNQITRHEVAKQLRQQRNHIKTVTYDTEVIVDSLKTQVEDAALNADIRSRYVVNWQNARTEQHLQAIDDKESVPNDSIDYYKRRNDHEQRVHIEVDMLINIAISETLEKVEQWMEKYDTDMEAIDLKIQIKKNDYQNMLDKRVQLEKTIEEHDKLMKEWIHFKDEREKARQYREKMTKSAIAVQAWWRGLLVRLQLGPYKVKKKKGGKDDKKKK